MLPKLSASLVCTLSLLLAVPGLCRAQTTINVPADQPNIQAAINVAADGDTVLVAPGTYFENVDFKGKAITVTGLPKNESPGKVVPPVIDGGGKGPAVRFTTGETDRAVLSYMTVRNGGSYASPPSASTFNPAVGGIYVQSSSPQILNNTIEQNLCYGIESDHGSPLIEGNTVFNTLDPGACFFGGGTGIFINGDRTTQNGAIVPAVVLGNTIEDNVQSGTDMADGAGAGGGAGIAAAGSTLIEDNVIRNNVTTQSGGGIDVTYATGMTIVQNLIYGNHAGAGGGAIALPLGSDGPRIDLIVANNTLVDNTGSVAQVLPVLGIIYPPIVGPTVVIANNIISGSTTQPAVDCSAEQAPSEALQPIFDHNVLYNAGGAFFGPNCVDVSARYGNVAADPKFLDAGVEIYQLSPGSPAVDAGNTSALQEVADVSGVLLSEDVAANARLQDASGLGYPVIDIGAYELPGVQETSPTRAVVNFSSYSRVPDSVEALSARLTSALGTPTGQVTFFLDEAPLLQPVPLQADGTAQLSGFVLAPGVHSVKVTYAGDGPFTPATSVIEIVEVDLISTTVTVESSSVVKPPQSYLGEPVTFTVKTSAADGTIPTPVTLTDTSTHTLLQTFNFPAGSPGTGTYTTSTLALGLHDIKAAYAGSAIYAAAGETITQLVTGYPTTTTLSCGTASTVNLGDTIPLSATVTSDQGTPVGSISFTQAGGTIGQAVLVNGAAGLNYTTQLAGYRTFIANYTPAAGSAFAASSGTCQLQVNALSLVLTSNNNPAFAYSPITFTATLTGTAIPAGTFALTIAGSAPVTMTASADGTSATYTTSALGPGTYPVTVVFTSASDGSVSAFLPGGEVVQAPNGDFTLTGPPSITFRTESSGSAPLLLTSLRDFSGTVALTCNLPLSTYTCTLAPASAGLTPGSTAPITLTLAPHLPGSSAVAGSGISPALAGSLLPLAGLCLAAFATRRRRFLRGVLPLAVLAVLAACTTACGNDVFIAATQPGAYSFSVTATGTTRGAATPTTHTLNITLNITP